MYRKTTYATNIKADIWLLQRLQRSTFPIGLIFVSRSIVECLAISQLQRN